MAANPMPLDASTATDIPVGDLLLDINNPRIRGSLPKGASQDELVVFLWRAMAVDELAYSIAFNGFEHVEPLLAVREGKRLVVIEGNRRLAAVRVLTEPRLQRLLRVDDLPTLTKAVKATLHALPVVECTRESAWKYIGFKHVNGPQTWQSYAKAQYIAHVHEDMNVSLNDVAKRIGDRNATVERLYRGLTILRQAENAGVFQLEQRAKTHFAFSHLYTGLDYPGIQEFLGISADAPPKKNPVPKSKLKHLGELCVWLFGDKIRDVEPAVQRQNPDLKILDDVLRSEHGRIALRRQLPLAAARQASLGDAALFRESLQTAKDALVRARGFSLHGYKGEKLLLAQASDIQELADELHSDMASRTIRTRAGKK